jgi:hypothetical protein
LVEEPDVERPGGREEDERRPQRDCGTQKCAEFKTYSHNIWPSFSSVKLELGVTAPSSHVDDVLNNNPARLKRLGKQYDLKRSVLTLIDVLSISLARVVLV